MEVDKKVLSATSNYLVKSTSGVLLGISCHDGSRGFSVIRINAPEGEWQVTNDLRGDAIFLSHNSPKCVAAADYPGVPKPNCIYFANDFVENPNPQHKGMGIYNFRDQSLEEFNFESSYSLSSAPLWVSTSA